MKVKIITQTEKERIIDKARFFVDQYNNQVLIETNGKQEIYYYAAPKAAPGEKHYNISSQNFYKLEIL